MSWTVELHTGANTWITQAVFINPDRLIMSDNIESTAEFVKTADGSTVISQPEFTYTKSTEPITLGWSIKKTTTLHTRIQNYIKSGSGLKLTTHTGKAFIGQFMRENHQWRLSGSKQKYDIETEFMQIDVDMLRDQQW